MGLAAPWFLTALAALALPVWLHLLRKHRSPPLRFSSLMFFEKRSQSSIRQRRLDYLLLLALRAGLLALLALAFAEPFVTTGGAGDGGSGKLVLLAIDESFSMRQGDRMERARNEAAGVLRTLRSGDRAQVLAFAGRVRVLTEPSADAGLLRAAVAEIEAGDGRSSFGELSGALSPLAQSARVLLEVHVFSDFQKNSLPSSFDALRPPAGARLFPHAVGKRLPNWTVESVAAPRRLHGKGKGTVRATVAGFGTEAVRRPVSLVVGDTVVETRSAEIPANGRANVEFTSLDAPRGLARAEVRLDSGDAFPEDDRFLFSVERAEPLALLFVHEPADPRSLLYYRAALESSAGGAFSVTSASPSQVHAPAKYALVVLSNVASLPADAENALREYVNGGGSLLIALGSGTAQTNIPVLGWTPLRPASPALNGQRWRTASWIDGSHPALRDTGRWEDVKFYRITGVQGHDARVLARAGDDAPLLLERRLGAGRVLVFTSTFDNLASDFPLHASFVPFVRQTAIYLCGLEDRPPALVVDSFVELRGRRTDETSVAVFGPDGGRQLSLSESASAAGLTLDRGGFYEIRRPGGQSELLAVNPDRLESDFEPAGADALALWSDSGGDARPEAAAGGDGASRRALWRPLLLAALILGLAESLLAGRYLQPRRETA